MKTMDDKQFDDLMKDMGEKKDGEKKGIAGDMWLPLFMAMLTIGNQPDNKLEKEIAYLHGKVDTLVEIVGGSE